MQFTISKANRVAVKKIAKANNLRLDYMGRTSDGLDLFDIDEYSQYHFNGLRCFVRDMGYKFKGYGDNRSLQRHLDLENVEKAIEERKDKFFSSYGKVFDSLRAGLT